MHPPPHTHTHLVDRHELLLGDALQDDTHRRQRVRQALNLLIGGGNRSDTLGKCSGKGQGAALADGAACAAGRGAGAAQCACVSSSAQDADMHTNLCHSIRPPASLTLTALRSAAAASSSALKMIPGESSSRMDLSSTTSCTPRVTPGVLPTWGGGGKMGHSQSISTPLASSMWTRREHGVLNCTAPASSMCTTRACRSGRQPRQAIQLRKKTRRTCATRARLSELMRLDLPTLGRPTTPTVIAVLRPRLRA